MLPTSHDLLANLIVAIEASAAAGGVNTMMARCAGEACVVLGLAELAERAGQILAQVPDQAFFAGALMSFEPDAEAIRACRRLESAELVERHYPPFRQAEVERSASWQEETRLAWQRRYHDALALARQNPREPPETSMVREIAVTAAILGDFDTAEQLLADEALRPGETYSVRLVLAIEYARYQRLPEAERVIASLEPPVEGWSSVTLALGLAGRRPWEGYPYADY